MNNKKYLGCGSRKTPDIVLSQMTSIAQQLGQDGWLLRSGAAAGADTAFEIGCDVVGGTKEIFLPWKKFNDSISCLFPPTSDAFDIASQIHPAWSYLSHAAKKLHARNAHQVLGLYLDDPVDLVICWTKDGREIGGTATAIKLAKQYKIKTINLAVEQFSLP